MLPRRRSRDGTPSAGGVGGVGVPVLWMVLAACALFPRTADAWTCMVPPKGLAPTAATCAARTSPRGGGHAVPTGARAAGCASSPPSCSSLFPPSAPPGLFGIFQHPNRRQGQQRQPSTTTRLYAKPGKNENADDDWEPDEEELLSELEDLGDLEVVDDDLNDGLVDPDEVEDDDEDDEDDYLDAEEDDDDYEDDVPARKRKVKNSGAYDDEDEDEDEEFQMESDDEIGAEDVEEDGGGKFASWQDEYEYLYGKLEQPRYDDGDDELDEDALQELLNDPDFEDLPLEDDANDPAYTAKLKMVQETVDRRAAIAAEENFDAFDYVRNRMTPEEMEVMDSFAVNREAERQSKKYIYDVISEADLADMDIEAEMAKTTDMFDDDPYVKTNVTNFMGTGVTDGDVEALDQAWKDANAAMAAEPWNKVDEKARYFRRDELDNTTKKELGRASRQIGGSSYNFTKWLIYDLDFNVSNLMLAACKHNPNAPVLLNHWLAQLEVYERYQHVRDRDFECTWEDVENADLEELKRYYKGFGYDEIPNKAPSETGLIGFGELDEEELKMAAFEKWMLEVYNEEWDKKDFDDDKIVDEDNVFSANFVMPDHPDLPTADDVQDDLLAWDQAIKSENRKVLEKGGEAADEILKYRDMVGEKIRYKPAEDKDFQENFRGHLVIACGNYEGDLDMAEAITTRFEKEFGNQVYVETRIIMYAREDDYVFEVWLESYEIDLLHSRRRNFLGTDGWEGPGDVDAKQLDHLVDEVRFLISDDARYSYRFTDVDLQVA